MNQPARKTALSESVRIQGAEKAEKEKRDKEAATATQETVHKLNVQIDRGTRARRIIEDPLFMDAFNTAEAFILGQFKDSKLADDDTRRHARESLGLLANLRRFFHQQMTTGTAAQKELVLLRDPSVLGRVFRRT